VNSCPCATGSPCPSKKETFRDSGKLRRKNSKGLANSSGAGKKRGKAQRGGQPGEPRKTIRQHAGGGACLGQRQSYNSQEEEPFSGGDVKENRRNQRKAAENRRYQILRKRGREREGKQWAGRVSRGTSEGGLEEGSPRSRLAEGRQYSKNAAKVR